MTCNVTLTLNTLAPEEATRHSDVELLPFLVKTFGEHFPPTARIFQAIEAEHSMPGMAELRSNQIEITPKTEKDIARLKDAAGEIHVVVSPAGAELAITSALLLTSVILQAIFPEDKKDPGRPPRQGSPTNALSNRQNRTRLLGRIQDTFGSRRITPDLVAQPYTIYDARSREVEICQMCLGRGTYEVNSFNIFEGDNRAQNVEGLSVEIYAPGVLPTLGSPQVTLGDGVGEPVRNVYRVEAVNGQRLASLNEKTIHGSTFNSARQPSPLDDEDLTGYEWLAMGFGYGGGNVGFIAIPVSNEKPRDEAVQEVYDRIQVGQTLELRYDPWGNTSVKGGSFDGKKHYTRIVEKGDFPTFNPVGGLGPNLADNTLGYKVTDIVEVDFGTLAPRIIHYVQLQVEIPPSLIAQWAAIPGFLGPGAEGFFNVACLLTPYLKVNGNFVNEEGAFFIDDPDMTSITCNFVSERGLFADDGKNVVAVNPQISVFVAPANSAGTATGAFQRFSFTLLGSSVDLSTRAITAVIDATAGLAITGRALISVIREDMALWRVEDPGQGTLKFNSLGTMFPARGPLIPVGGTYPPSFWNPPSTPTSGPNAAFYRPRKGTIQDEVRWTHCYSLSDPGVPAFGDTTLVMAKTVANKANNVRNDRKLSMIATRMIPTWNGSTFGGPLNSSEFAEDIFMAICKDQALGNLPNAQIDFFGIAAAFQEVRTYFDDGDAGRFNHTFDSENETFADMLSKVAESCFCVAYREGQVIKVKPNLATDDAVLLFNHRNMVANDENVTETRTVTFGSEADYDGAKIDYFDDSSNTLKTLVVPKQSAKKPRELSVAGLTLRSKAAWHAWRAFLRIKHKTTDTEFVATPDAAIAIINDRILVADQTSQEIQDGEVLGISGAQIFTSQPVDLSLGGQFTCFLQHTDGSVEPIIVISAPDSRHLNLNSVPSLPLVTDDTQGIGRTRYMLVGAVQTRPQAFLVTDKQPNDRMTWAMRASNYAHAYYWVDGLQLWLDPNTAALADQGPYQRDVVNNGGTLSSDPTRGLVYVGGGVGDFVSITPSQLNPESITSYTSYTKVAWIFKTATGTGASILSFGNDESLFITPTNQIGVRHNNIVQLLVPGFPIAAWNQVVLTYDRPTNFMELSLNGLPLFFQAAADPQSARSAPLVAFADLDGKADDLRLYRRAWTRGEVLEHYQKTKK